MTPQVDPWSIDALEARVDESYGVGTDSDLPEDLRFIRGVTELARARHARGEVLGDQPIVFVLEPRRAGDTIGSRAASSRVPMLDEADDPIAGRIWFVNHVVNDGFSVDLLPEDTKSSILEFVCDEAGLASRPAAVILMKPDEFVVRFYPDGLGNPDTSRRQALDVTTLSCSEVLEVMDGLWERELATPLAQGHVGTTWKDARSLVPIREAELMVQRVMKAGLTGRYLGLFKVHQEQTGVSGRFDLLIEQPDPVNRSQVTKHVLIELKVLREKWASGRDCTDTENQEAIEKGITQAAQYRDEWNVRSSALCCFDMRREVRGSRAFEGHEARAMERSVELWIRHLFSTAEAYRDYQEGLIAAS